MIRPDPPLHRYSNIEGVAADHRFCFSNRYFGKVKFAGGKILCRHAVQMKHIRKNAFLGPIRQPGFTRPGTDVMIFEIFSPKKIAKNWRF
jgi:hypothetical protein